MRISSPCSPCLLIAQDFVTQYSFRGSLRGRERKARILNDATLVDVSKTTISQSEESKDRANDADYANDGDADSIVSSVPSGQSCIVVPRPANRTERSKKERALVALTSP